MKVLIWGSRNLTSKHLPLFRGLARYAMLEVPPPLGAWILDAEDGAWRRPWLPDSSPLILFNGDGPPGSKVRGAVGADKLALLACMETWPERRRVRWFPPEPKRDATGKEVETWAQAAARRDVEMAEARPDRAFCIHENLDSSRGSIITANALTRLGLRFHYLKVTPAGDLVSVEQR